MKEKAKRGRRTFPRVLLFIFIFIAMFLVFVNNFEETSERIIYLYEEEHLFSNLWMLDLKQPDETQQLTFYQSPYFVYRYQALTDTNAIVYEKINVDTRESEFIYFDLDNNSEISLAHCAGFRILCPYFDVHPAGNFIVYEYYENLDIHEIRLIDLTTMPYQEQVVYSFDIRAENHNAIPIVVGHQSVIAFLLPETYEMQLYNVEENQLLETLPLGMPNRRPTFSDDGSRYAYYNNELNARYRTIEFRDTNTPHQPLNQKHEVDYEFVGSILDWHSDNERVLVTEQSQSLCHDDVEKDYLGSQIHIFNLLSSNIETLPIIGLNGSWNGDETEIIYNYMSTDCVDGVPQIYSGMQYELAIYDVVSGENMPLGIQGVNPQWLDG